MSSQELDNQGDFETKWETAIRTYKVYGTSVTARLYVDDKKERYFHIYYNPSKRAGARDIWNRG